MARRHTPPIAAPPDETLLDVVDRLIDKGVALDGEVVLGLADVDLIYLRVGVLLAAADRVLEPGGTAQLDPPGRSRRSPRPAGTTRAEVSSPPPSPARPSPRRALAAPAGQPSDTSRSVIRLVLTLVEFIRGLLERQALRRVADRTLSADETERLGRALMLLEETIYELANRHGIDPSELNLDLGPLGRLR